MLCSDLLTYVLSPSFIRKRMRHKPPDAARFVEMIRANPAVPRSVYNDGGRKRNSQKPATSTGNKKMMKWLS